MLTIFSKNTRQLQTNARNQVNRMLVIIARKQTHIGELLREKFVFQLVIRQRDQNILNSQRQILALQNNPPNIQHIGMAGYPPPKFHGLAGEDPADYIRDLLICINSVKLILIMIRMQVINIEFVLMDFLNQVY